MTDERPRLDKRAVAGHLELLDELLSELESASGPTAALALDALATLAGVYGEALARIAERVVAAAPEVGAALADDLLLAHLFVLHEVSVGAAAQGSGAVQGRGAVQGSAAAAGGAAFIPLDALTRRPATSRAAP